MTVRYLSITAGNPNTGHPSYAHSRKMFNASVNMVPDIVQPAPFVYVDSASTMAALSPFPLSTAVVIGNKYAWAADTLHPYLYFECTVAGTTSASQPNAGIFGGFGFKPEQALGMEFVSGTSKFRVRRHQGWARAKLALEANIVPQTSVGGGVSENDLAWTVLVASTHAQLVATAFNLNLMPVYSPVTSNSHGYSLISVSKATAIPTTFAAGASVLGTGNSAGMMPTTNSNYNNGMVRGVVMGHDNTAVSAGSYTDRYQWGNVRFYDCTFQSYRINNFVAGTLEGIHAGARHSVRCAYKSLAAANPDAVIDMGLANPAGTNLEVPTFTRLTSATTPLFRVIGGNSATDAFVLGADLSTFTGGKVFAEEGTGLVHGWHAFRAFGTRIAAGGLTQPSPIWAEDVAFCMVGSTATEELNSARPEVGSQWTYDSINNASLGFPDVSRELTIIRTGGASDALGAYSRKTAARLMLGYPITYEFWNSKIDESFLITMEYQWSNTGTGLTRLSKEDVWLEAVYFNHPTRLSTDLVFSFDKYNRRGLIHSDATGPDLAPLSSASWAGSLTGAVKQSMSVVVTPKQIGPIKLFVGTWLCPWIRNIASVTSITLYICPLPTLGVAP